MYPASFDYHAPTSVDDALRLLGTLGDDAKLLAGGHSLIPLLKLRFARPAHLIDLRRIPGLAGIRADDDQIVIGALTTHRTLERSTLLRGVLPILPEAAERIGDPLVRNAGTIGGSLAHADPGADLPAVMLALGAELRTASPRGGRTIAADDFFIGLLTSALEPDELLTEIRVRRPGPATGGAYAKRPHPASRFALVGAAVVVTLGAGETVSSARVALTGVGERAIRVPAAEGALVGRAPDAATIERAATEAAAGVEPRADLQGDAEYKRHLTRVITQRAIARAVERARG
ncbi:molybdopterin dehydrogenase FAD-binding protein [Gemmatirosa kalamazoonensis]|jgi:carbon-monoxide dehydrogenase medium subunit|uniref:Molybdopterin dehydrogenase FAD-binding protein n=1 Tax=Gemmatirosa kalamazoonensis TaxID=861299 RepID=W0RJY1_9BACT|nr:xanthine dehydrogenase family protein subunit M [Gemmatirosa kalamazoonensis]AHG89698.1 molybdopterin dehydrogenase FAD-binding protein [Gemmatirosa kalamazoonensis]